MESKSPSLPRMERRRYARVAMAAEVVIDAKSHRIKNLSQGGFCLINGIHWMDVETSAEIVLHYGGLRMALPAVVQPVFYDAGRNATGFEFLGLSNDVLTALSAVIDASPRSAPDHHVRLDELVACIAAEGGSVTTTTS